MYINGWMTNVNVSEIAQTKKFIEENDGLDLKVDTTGANGPEYKWTQYCDDDEDMVKIAAVMMFYNDRSPEQIEEFKSDLRELMKKYERI
ncbi:hypothetical protein EVB97_113 [Rhizobium phage RHph_Y65]|uniref:Uncharacterized protein n=1 Tax=Rhizobium phage RHph_Y65 TaxID=2509785 RepID=A0A7S5R7R7_9CAUD|nr:hypothetical protein PQC17_gp113 [Rhizobium phage RHph_Y65]QIG72671.1 hypothetical protein EVB97_113 [Rhizobium phage RHph_Y65]